ncbi:MAG TPA: hypothetical protein VE153_30415, partial [Myxococcus sp.]|nr:hypothetical protein [Myxococcus sp.]
MDGRGETSAARGGLSPDFQSAPMGRGFIETQFGFAGDCVSFSGPGAPDSSTGQTVDYSVDFLDSQSGFYSRVGISGA